MNKIDFSKLDEAYNSAPMVEVKKLLTRTSNTKKKIISIPLEWDEKIRNYYTGTLTSYIRVAIMERLQKDGLI
jgi:hypothetical protein